MLPEVEICKMHPWHHDLVQRSLVTVVRASSPALCVGAAGWLGKRGERILIPVNQTDIILTDIPRRGLQLQALSARVCPAGRVRPAPVCAQRQSRSGANLPRGSPALELLPLPTVCQGAFLLLLLQKRGASGEYPWQETDIASQKHPLLWRG